MLIHRLKVSGLLSFGPQGIDLPLAGLNVLIGPNGSGKSNLLEVLALLKAAPVNLARPVKEVGGIGEWLWKNGKSAAEASIETILGYEQRTLRHGFSIAEHGGRIEVTGEWIENETAQPGESEPAFFYRLQHGQPVLSTAHEGRRDLPPDEVNPEQSILSQVRDPQRYRELTWLQRQYEQIRLYRNWSFGPGASFRREQSTHGSGDFLDDGGDNLALVLSDLGGALSKELLHSLEKLYGGIEGVGFKIHGGTVLFYLQEKGGRQISSTRLSDGTLRYLCLLAILLHPEPPPLIAIEEPELGLHPDVIPHIAELMLRASERTQLVVTTHSRTLVDALGKRPETVIVCEQRNGESHFERLDATRLADWLQRYSLGELWSIGELGGNRW